MLKNYNFNKNNILTLRILISVSLAFYIGYVFSLDRSYWAVLTILSININIHWEDLISRSWGRVSMTIIGCLIGSLIYQNFLLSFGILPMLIVIVSSALVTVYFTLTSYNLSILFTSFYIVTFFGSLGQWNYNLLADRIYETLIGAIISISAALIIYPRLANNHLKKSIIDLWDKQFKSFQSLSIDLENRILKAHFLKKKQRIIKKRLTKSTIFAINKKFTHYYLKSLALMEETLTIYQKWLELLSQLKEDQPNEFIDLMIENFKDYNHQIQYIDRGKGKLARYIDKHRLSIHEQILLGYYTEFILKLHQIDCIIKNEIN